MGRSASQADDPFSREIVGRIEQAIQESGLSKQFVLTNAQMSADYFYKRMRGVNPFTTNDIYKICKVIGVDAISLMREAANNIDTTEHQDALSVEERAQLALERAKNAAEYGLAAMRGDKREDDSGWDS